MAARCQVKNVAGASPREIVKLRMARTSTAAVEAMAEGLDDRSRSLLGAATEFACWRALAPSTPPDQAAALTSIPYRCLVPKADHPLSRGMVAERPVTLPLAWAEVFLFSAGPLDGPAIATLEGGARPVAGKSARPNSTNATSVGTRARVFPLRRPNSGAACKGAEIWTVPDKNDATLSEIEKTQAALRESIEQAKDLAAQSERLIKKRRKEIKRGD